MWKLGLKTVARKTIISVNTKNQNQKHISNILVKFINCICHFTDKEIFDLLNPYCQITRNKNRILQGSPISPKIHPLLKLRPYIKQGPPQCPQQTVNASAPLKTEVVVSRKWKWESLRIKRTSGEKTLLSCEPVLWFSIWGASTDRFTSRYNKLQ